MKLGLSPTDMVAIEKHARSMVYATLRDRARRLVRSLDRPVAPHQRWDYNPTHKLPGES